MNIRNTTWFEVTNLHRYCAIASRLAIAMLIGIAVVLAATDYVVAMPPSDQLLPETTSGYISITNINTLKAKWEKTQLGELFNDKVMEPFIQDLSQQFNEKLTKLSSRIGLKVDDFVDVASGEIAAGYANMTESSSAIMVLIDVTGNIPKATALLQKVSDKLIEEGATRTMVDGPEGSETKIVSFKLPLIKIKPKKDAPEGTQPETVQYYVYYFITQDVLCCTNDLEAAKMLVDRLENPANIPAGTTLESSADFQTVMKRCSDDATEGTVPEIRWFVNPYKYFQAILLGTPEARRPTGKSIADILRHQGIDGVKGIGGWIEIPSRGAAGEQKEEMIHRSYIYAPPPYKYALAAVRFIDGVAEFGPKAFAPEPWVPRGVSTYQTTYFDVDGAVRRFGPIFNEILGPPSYIDKIEGKQNIPDLDNGIIPQALIKLAKDFAITLDENAKVQIEVKGKRWRIIQPLNSEDEIDPEIQREEILELRAADDSIRVYHLPDIWKETLESLKLDGPKIDLYEDFTKHMGPRISVLSDYKVPVTEESNRLLIAIQIDDTQQVAEVLKKLFKDDVTCRHLEYKLQTKDEEGNPKEVTLDIWERQVNPEEAEDIIEDPLDLDSGPGGSASESEVEETDEAEMSILPHRAMIAIDGQLLIASHLDYLKYILEYQRLYKIGQLEPNKTLAEGIIDFTRVNTTIVQMNLEKQVLRRFVRLDEALRVSYELLREGKIPESNLLIGRLFDQMLTEETMDNIREEKLNAKSLPEYDIVRRYLGPAGLVVCDEEEGWFIKGFILTKQ